MSSGLKVTVKHCVIVLSPKRRDKEVERGYFLESSAFIFQASECRGKVSCGWEGNERKICKFYLYSEPMLLPKFYVTVCVFKGNDSISYPKRVVMDPSKYIWSASFADIEKAIPGAERWNVNFRFIFETECDPEYPRKSSGDQFVQTSYCPKESGSLEKLSIDFERLLDGAPEYYDIEVKCRDLVIKAHKSVLIARSPFFGKILKSSKKDRIELQNIDPAAFHEIMRHIYTGKLPDLSFETAKNICKAGDVCNTELKERCVEFVTQNLTEHNACECLTFTDDEDFKGRIIKYIIHKGIPYLDEHWKPFCDAHPKSANEVYYKLVRLLKPQDCQALPTGTFKKHFLR